MSRKRIKKHGFVYLLKSDIGIYKYGCTTLTPKARCRRVNVMNKNYGKFCLIDSYKSKDIYTSEAMLKYKLWESHMAPLEFFLAENESELLEIFNSEKARHEQ